MSSDKSRLTILRVQHEHYPNRKNIIIARNNYCSRKKIVIQNIRRRMEKGKLLEMELWYEHTEYILASRCIHSHEKRSRMERNEWQLTFFSTSFSLLKWEARRKEKRMIKNGEANMERISLDFNISLSFQHGIWKEKNKGEWSKVRK